MSLRTGARIWIVGVWIVALTTLLLTSVTTDVVWYQPVLLFWVVVIGAGACAVFAAVLVVRAFASATAETALFGSFVWAISILPFAHGLLTPGVLYDANEAFALSVQLAIPVGAISILPLALPRSRRSNRMAARWRTLVPAHMGATAILTIVLLVSPDSIPAAPTGSPAAIAIAVASMAVAGGLSWRHAGLAMISGSWAAFAVAVGVVLVGSVPSIFFAADGFGAAFWLAHVFDIVGVFLAAILAMVAYRRSGTLTQLLETVEAVTPLHSLEVGLDDIVHRFVAELDRKDQITRDHVVRTARLAVEVSTELRLPPADVRLVGIGAILHDVGKLMVPGELLAKPGSLTADEFAVIKTHAQLGADLVSTSPVLGPVTEIVRGHHERIDGAGYPQGLSGDRIPLGARIVSTCDAFDAMANTRQYREGMGRDRALTILREHAGAQWDADVVAALERVVGRHDLLDAGVLDRVGRDVVLDDAHHWCSCRDALPNQFASAGADAAG
jgi:putative nucleotidyltransferase with HDIG domain